MPSSDDDDKKPDLPMSADEQAIYDNLSEYVRNDMDLALLAECAKYNRKVARIVATVFMSKEFKDTDASVLCFAQRVVELVKQRKLIADGNLNFIRYSEVRLPAI